MERTEVLNMVQDLKSANEMDLVHQCWAKRNTKHTFCKSLVLLYKAHILPKSDIITDNISSPQGKKKVFRLMPYLCNNLFRPTEVKYWWNCIGGQVQALKGWVIFTELQGMKLQSRMYCRRPTKYRRPHTVSLHTDEETSSC